MKYSTLRVKKSKDVAVITFNRPRSLNAINKTLLTDLQRVIKSVEKDKKLRFVILTGDDKAFCVGGDLKEMIMTSKADSKKRSEIAQDITTMMEQSRKIYIAKIKGYCLGGGMEFALACDFRIASPNATLGQPEARVGIIPGYGGSARFPRAVGLFKAKYYLLTGEFISAKQALAMGLVDKVGNVETEVKKLINTLRNNAPSALARIKQIFYESSQIKDLLKIERKQFASVFGTKEQQEGMRAFIEKRKPKW